MKSKEVLLDSSIGNDSMNPRIGGLAFLPTKIEWPKNPDGEKLVLVASIPTNFIEDCTGIHLEKKFVSVFTTYNPDDYFLDLVSYHGDEEEKEMILKGYTKVIYHDDGDPINNSKYVIPARRMMISEKEINNDSIFTGSKIGGTAGLLQNKSLPLVEGKTFCIQFYGGDFPKDYDGIFDLSDAVGYLFLDSLSGIFFVQAT